MSVSLTGDVGRTAGGLGELIFYGVLAYIAYSIYKGSSLSSWYSTSTNWKPLSDDEINKLRYYI